MVLTFIPVRAIKAVDLGIFRLGAYVDIVLIVCVLFLIVRLSSYLSYERTFGERKEGIE